MSLSPEDDVGEEIAIPTPRIKLDDEFISSEQDKMNVYVRIRPLLPEEVQKDNKICICIEDSTAVTAVAPLESAKFKSSTRSNSDLQQIFRFTRTFGPEVDQVQFFEETMKTTIENFIRGQNELVFAYGSTGSGKTYTMQGGSAQPGVIPLTIYMLFSSIKEKQVMSPLFKPHKYSDVTRLNKFEQDREESAREALLSKLDSEDFYDSKNSSGKSSVSVSTIFSEDSLDTSSHPNLTNREMSILESTLRMKNIAHESVIMQGAEILFSIWVSFVEIYNENMFDLLEPVTSNKRERLSLKEDENRNVYVNGLKEIRVTSSEEALKLFRMGKRNLRIASTKLNYQSSRSHCIFTIKIIQVLGTESPSSARVNRLSYCDLAGSERTGKTQNTGARLKEAGNINTSLMVLGRCIEILRQPGTKDKKVVPYRDSKLTRMFSAYFMGKGKASMIINVSPASHIFDETLSVLKFSALAKQVISNDMSIKPISHWENEVRRLTDAWEKSSTHWSSFCRRSPQKDSVDVIAETSMEDENDESYDEILQRDQLIEDLLGHVNTLTTQLKNIMVEKQKLEGEIRAQVCREFAENFVRIDKCYREQLNDLESGKTPSEICKELKSDVSKDADEEDNAEDSEGSDDEKGYTSAYEDQLPAVSEPTTKVVDSETETPEGKSLQDKESLQPEQILSCKGEEALKITESAEEKDSTVASQDPELNKYLESVKSKDHEITDLKRKLEEMSATISSHEKKLAEYNNLMNLKDVEISLLSGSDVDHKANGIKQHETALRCKDEEIIALKKKIEEEHFDVLEKAKELEEYKNGMKLKDTELAQLKRELEENGIVALKEDESKESEIKSVQMSELQRTIKKLQEDVSLKDKEIADYKNIVNLKNTEVSFLKGKMEESEESIPEDKELEQCKNILNSREKELSALTEKLEQQEVTVAKSADLKEFKKSLNSKEAEIMKLKKSISELEASVTSKETLIQELESTIQKGGDILITKDTEIDGLQKQLSEVKDRNNKSKDGRTKDDSNIIKSQEMEIASLKEKIEKLNREIGTKDDDIKICGNEDRKTGEMLCIEDKKITELQQKIAEVGSKVLESKAPEWQNVQYLTQLVQESSKAIASQNVKVAMVEKKYNDLEEKFEEGKKLIQQDFSSKLEEQEASLAKKNQEIEEMQCKLEEREKNYQELNEKFEKQVEDLSTKNNIIQELESELKSKIAEEAKSKEQHIAYEDQIKVLGDMVKVLQQTEFQSNNRVSELEKQVATCKEELNKKNTEVQELINKASEEEKERQKAEEGQKAPQEKQKAEEEREKAEEGKQKAEEIMSAVEEQKQRQAEEDKQRAEEERERLTAEERKKMSRTEKEIQTKDCEIQKCEQETQTENFENMKITVDSSDHECNIEHQKRPEDVTTQKDLKSHEELYSSEHSEKIKDCKDEASKIHEDSIEVSGGDEKHKKSTEPQGKQAQATFGEALVSCLQWIEMIAAENIVRLNNENRNYSKKLLNLSEELKMLRIKLADAELEISQNGDVYRKQKPEESHYKPREEPAVDSQQSLHLIETLQKIEHVSEQNINKLTDENSRLECEKKGLLEQIQAATVELELVTKEIETKDKDCCKLQSQLRKKEARIVCLELELSEAQKNVNKLENKNRVQLLEEQTQHGIEVEQVMALKRQAETDYRSLERKFFAATGSTEDLYSKKKTRGRVGRPRGKKRTSTDEDEDFVPSQKKRAVKSQAYFDDDSSTYSTEPQQLHSTEPSSFQRLHEYVSEKSPVIKAIAQRIATFRGPKSKSGHGEESKSSVKKRKLFNSAIAVPLIASPVQETVKKISPKKVVNRKFRNKKDPK